MKEKNSNRNKTQCGWRPPWDQGWLTKPVSLLTFLILGCWLAVSSAQGAALGSPTVTPASLAAAQVGNVTISLIPVTAIPANGKIVVVFPAGFSIAGATAPVIVSGLNATLSAGVVGQTLTITRTGAGAVSSGTVAVRISGITNPGAGATGTFTVSTTDSVNGAIDTGTAPLVTITPNVTLTQPTHGSILENAPGVPPATQTIDLAGITGVGPLLVTAVSTKQSSVRNQNIRVIYTSTNDVGTVLFTPVADISDQVGNLAINVTVRSLGNGGTLTRSVAFDILPVNRAPNFTLSTNRVVVAGGTVGAQTLANFYKFVNWGNTNESGQAAVGAHVTVAAADPAMFTAIGISGNGGVNGTLSYQLAANQYGPNVITVTLQDDGGVANGGIDTTTKTFVLDVTPVNAKPSFNVPAKLVSLSVNPGAYKSSSFITGINPGSTFEQSQIVKFFCIASSNAFFRTLPAIDNFGTLTFTVANDAFGFVPVKVYAQDNGGTFNGGIDMSDTNTFYVSVQNPDTTFVAGLKDVTLLEDAKVFSLPIRVYDGTHGHVTVQPWDPITSTVVSADPLGIVAIAITGNGTNRTVTLTPNANANGVTTVTLKATDGYRTTYSNFKVTVTAVNDAPAFASAIKTISGLSASTAGIPYNYAAFLTGLSVGPANEASQTAAFTVTTTAPKAFFGVAPTIANVTTLSGGTADLTFQVAPGQSGTNTITVTMKDSGGSVSGGKNSFAVTYPLEVAKTYLAPVVTLPALITDPLVPIVLNKNFGTTNLPISLSDLDTTITKVKLAATSSDVTKVKADVTGTGATRTLTLTSLRNAVTGANTPILVTVTADDQDLDANGASKTDSKPFTVTVLSVNTAPVITQVKAPAIYEDDAPRVVVPLTITDENNNLTVAPISSKPSLIAVTANNGGDGHNAGWHLDLVPVANANSTSLGSAAIVVSVTDDGDNGDGSGANAAAKKTSTMSFVANVTAVNDAPTFALAAIPWSGNAVEHVVPNFIQNLSLGGADEVNQTWAPTVTAADLGAPVTTPMFLKAPAIDSAGTLRFTPGTPTTTDGDRTIRFSVTVKDSGGTANSGADTSAAVTQDVTFKATPFGAYGEFQGLFYDRANRPDLGNTAAYDKAGYLYVNLAASGNFSGYLLTVGTSNYLSGTFSSVKVGNTYPTSPANISIVDPPLTLALEYSNTVAGAEQIIGTVSDAAGTWSPVPQVRAIRSIVGGTDPNYAAGYYTMVIQGAANDTTGNNAPVGDGLTWVVVDDTGYVSVNGWLGDGTPVTIETAISSGNEFPLYASLYGGKGAVFGWVKFDTSAVIAPNYDPMLITVAPYKVQWEKAAVATDTYYPSGFNAPIVKPTLVSPFEPWLGWNGLDAAGVTPRVGLYGTGGLLGDSVSDRAGFDASPSELTFDAIDATSWSYGMVLGFDPANAYVAGTLNVDADGSGNLQSCYGVYLQAQKEVRGFFVGSIGLGEVGQLFIGRKVTSITVSPTTAQNAHIAALGTLQFTATAVYSDGSSKDITKEVVWSSGTPARATIDVNGLASHAGAVGVVTITATLRGDVGSSDVTTN